MKVSILSRTQDRPTPCTALAIWGHAKLKQLAKRNDLISTIKCVITFHEIKELATRELANRYLSGETRAYPLKSDSPITACGTPWRRLEEEKKGEKKERKKERKKIESMEKPKITIILGRSWSMWRHIPTFSNLWRHSTGISVEETFFFFFFASAVSLSHRGKKRRGRWSSIRGTIRIFQVCKRTKIQV